MEVILTFLLITVILSTATRIKIMGPNAALPVGATVALCGLFAKPVSGSSMNPARSFGPALIGGSLGTVWIYIIGPFLGSFLAVMLAYLILGRESQSEAEAAKGEETDKK